jgi:transposase
MGNLLAARVHAANEHDTMSGGLTASIALWKYPSIVAFCADKGYRGTFVEQMLNKFNKKVDISQQIRPVGEFVVEPIRWVVERTNAWNNNQRRLSKDYEIRLNSEEAFLYIANFATLIRRY